MTARRTFTKQRADAPAGFFAAEAAGLRWLAAAPGGVAVAEPLRVWDGGIELPWLPAVPATQEAAERLGRGLAATHAAGATAYGSPPAGWDGDGFIGPLPLPHGSFGRWGEFYARLRLQPYAEQAHAAGALSPQALGDVGRVCDRLLAGELDAAATPSRIHGDLWSGNVVWTPDGPVLVDPAAHGGHPETDLAMLALFGLPQLDTVVEAYQDVSPLADGWRERVPLHQLHPLLVHAVLFGGGYGEQAARAARRYR